MAWTTDLLDNFSTDTITAGKYTFDAGSGSVSVTSGELAFSSLAEKVFYRNDRTAQIDFRLTSKRRRPNVVLTTFSHGLALRRIDASNYILCQQSGTSLQIFKKDGGTFTQLSSVAGITGDGGPASYWQRTTGEGNALTIERFTADPNGGAVATDTLTHTLTGGDATKFGAVSSIPGQRWSINSTSDIFGDDFRIEIPAAAHSVTLTPATETDTAQAPVARKLATLGPAAETDTAQALTVAKHLSVTSASETDTARALSIAKHVSLVPASETDSAQALSVTHTQYRTLTPATETDVGQALSFIKPIHVTLTPATESDTAQTLSVNRPQHVTLVPATETDVARPLTVQKLKSLIAAVETDAAQALSLTHVHYRTLTPASEIDTAVAVTVLGQEAVDPEAAYMQRQNRVNPVVIGAGWDNAGVLTIGRGRR